MRRGAPLAAVAVALVLGAGQGHATPSTRIVFAADRAPTVTGEIYRVEPNGHTIDLSRSPFQDQLPSVSPDGRRVGFFSDRSGAWAAYTVGIGGRGLRRLGPAGNVQSSGGELDWQPHGKRVAVLVYPHAWIERVGRRPVAMSGAGYVGGWSPDGHVLVVGTTRHRATGVAPDGRRLWSIPGFRDWSAWSSQGLVALTLQHAVSVHDEHGRLVFSVATGGGSGAVYGHTAWSPDGRYLAVLGEKTVQVRTATGGLVLHRRVAHGGGLVWAANGELVVGNTGKCFCRSIAVAVPSGKVSKASNRWLDPLSADRRLAVVTFPRNKGASFALGAAPPDGGRAKTYARVSGCWANSVRQAAIGSQQFAGRAIVYQSWGYCDAPYANLYSVAPGGGALQRLTNVQADERAPAPSPDGNRLAYTWQQYTAGSCDGCALGIRVANADGSDAQALTSPEECTFDSSPAWSPDGTTILFAEVGCDSSPGTAGAWKLETVPAGGGAVHDLGVAGREPAWGPSRIAYVGAGRSDRGVWTAKPDGSDPVKVASTGRSPAWSTDTRLAYLTGTSVVVDGTKTQLPFAEVDSLAWSPDGTRFVVVARTKGAPGLDVYTVATDGTDPVRLTKNVGASSASWR